MGAGADGTDINGVWRTPDGRHVITAEDSGLVRVLPFPCAAARAPAAVRRCRLTSS